jgi:ribosomal protein L6P/L9E
LDKNKLALDLGYSNLIIYKNNPILSLKNYKNRIILFSTNLEYLKDVAFQLRCYAKPDPYKGKGIVFLNESLKLKKKKIIKLLCQYILL